MIAVSRPLVLLAAAIGLLAACTAPGQAPATAPAPAGAGPAAPAAAGAQPTAPARVDASPAAAAADTVKIGYLGANMSNAGIFIAAD